MWKVLCFIVATLIGQGVTIKISREKATSVGIDATTDKVPQTSVPDGDYELEIEPLSKNLTYPWVRRKCPKCICGVNGRSGRIMGGSTTEPNEYPWMALIYTHIGLCGGTVINSKYVLTAAHCVYEIADVKKYIRVRLMEHDFTTKDESKHMDFKVNKIIIHPEYNPNKTYDNDIALLRLNTKGLQFDHKTGVIPVCRPTKEETYVGYTGIAAGWGTKMLDGKPTKVLHHVQLPIISFDECSNILSSVFECSISNNTLCAMYSKGGRDTCLGDSGGPLLIKNKSTFHIVGVISWGLGCGDENLPGIYTRVNSYLDWLQENTKDACYCAND